MTRLTSMRSSTQFTVCYRNSLPDPITLGSRSAIQNFFIPLAAMTLFSCLCKKKWQSGRFVLDSRGVLDGKVEAITEDENGHRLLLLVALPERIGHTNMDH